jgi:hypothetical protein
VVLPALAGSKLPVLGDLDTLGVRLIGLNCHKNRPKGLAT